MRAYQQRALISFIKGFMHAWFMLSFITTWVHMIGREERRKEGRAKGGGRTDEEEEAWDGMGQGVHHTHTHTHTHAR